MRQWLRHRANSALTSKLPRPFGLARSALVGQLYATRRAFQRRRYGWKAVFKALRSSVGVSPQLVILLANQRSGTSLFCSLFEQLPGCGSIYEALNPGKSRLALSSTNGPELVSYLRRAASSEGSRYVLTKAFYDHLRDIVDIKELAAMLPDSSFIILWRRDQLASYVSLLLAEKTGVWHQMRGDDPAQAGMSAAAVVSVDVEQFRAFRLKQIKDTFDALTALSAVPKVNVICYEDMAADRAGTINRFAHGTFGSGIHPSDIEEWFRRSDRVLSEVVTNWEEIAAMLGEERYHPAPLDVTKNASNPKN